MIRREDVVLGDPTTMMDKRGAPRTISLFHETFDHGVKDNYEPVFCLKHFDDFGCISMHRLFMEDADPTGYTTCMRTVGSWKVWQRIWRNRELAPHLEAWKEELEVKLRAEAIIKMRKSDTPSAAQWLAKKGWEEKVGRPTKAQIAREAKKEAEVLRVVDEDAERIGLIN